MSINRVMISGNLTRDPERRESANGTDVLRFSVAVNDRVKNASSGQWEDYANFVDCVAFGKRVDFFDRNLSKGSKVAVEGHLHWSSWVDKTGGKRSRLELVVDDLELMSGAKRQEESTSEAYDDIPF